MDNTLLLYFALPVAISILSIIFETLINSPIKIAGITFSILLIYTFAGADVSFLIFTILYTLLSYIVAWITRQWCQNNSCDRRRDQTIEELIQNSSINNQTIPAGNSYNSLNENYNMRFRRR